MNENKKNEKGAEQNASLPMETQIVERPVAEKPTLSGKIAQLLRSDDYKMIFGTIYKNVIDPAVRRILVDAGNALLRGIIYHDMDQMSGNFNDHVNYKSYWSGGGSSNGSESRAGKHFNEIPFRSEDAANEVLNRMRGKLRQKGYVLVSDYYKFAHQTPKDSYFNWGWINLNGAYVFPYTDRNGRVYAISFPEPVYFDTNSSN